MQQALHISATIEIDLRGADPTTARGLATSPRIATWERLSTVCIGWFLVERLNASKCSTDRGSTPPAHAPTPPRGPRPDLEGRGEIPSIVIV